MACKKGDRLKPGNESRSAIVGALLMAGPAGMSRKDLARVVGLQPNGIAWHLERMPDEVFWAAMADTRKSRAFHASHRADGEAYIASCTVGRQSRGGPSLATFDRVLAIIERSGRAGIGIKYLMSASGLAKPTLAAIMPKLVRDRGVRMERPSGNGKGRPAHYWAHDENQVLRQPAGSDLLGTRRQPDAPIKPRKTPSKLPATAKAWNGVGLRGGDFEPIYTGRETRTVAPTQKPRFHVDEPTKFFSALPFGVYPERSGSNIARAYGEQP